MFPVFRLYCPVAGTHTGINRTMPQPPALRLAPLGTVSLQIYTTFHNYGNISAKINPFSKILW